jgi:hypothetical protein
VDRGTEEVIKELRCLTAKKRLSNEKDLERAKQFMMTLRRMRYANFEVSKLTDGGWSKSTVELYTIGVTIDNCTRTYCGTWVRVCPNCGAAAGI